MPLLSSAVDFVSRQQSKLALALAMVGGIGFTEVIPSAECLAQGYPRSSGYHGGHFHGSGVYSRQRSYGGWGGVSTQGPGWVGGTFTSGGMITYTTPPFFPGYYGGWGNYGAVPYNTGWGAYGPGMAGPIGGYSWGVEQTGLGIPPSRGANVYTPVWGPNGFQNQYVGTYGGLGPLGGSIIGSPLPTSAPLWGTPPGAPLGAGGIGPQGDLNAIGPIPDQFGIDAAIVEPAQRPVAASGPDSKIRSLEAQSLGDHWFRQQQWAKAFVEYRKAVSLADDRGEAHFRTGLCLAAMGRHTSAVAYFKRALYLNPEIAREGASLVMLFGQDNDLARMNTIHRASDWVREDIRDTDRLFLLGLLLHFDRDPRSIEVLQAGLQMAGRGPHFEVLLASQLAPAQNGNEGQPLEGRLNEGQANAPVNLPGMNRAVTGVAPSGPQPLPGGAPPAMRHSPVNPPTAGYTVIQPRGAQPRANPTAPQVLPRGPVFDPVTPDGRGPAFTPQELPPLPSRDAAPIDIQPPAPALDEMPSGAGRPPRSPLPPPPVAPLPDEDANPSPASPAPTNIEPPQNATPPVLPALPGISGAPLAPMSGKKPAGSGTTGPMLPPPSP
ncbi:MAG: hypothetical protein C0478_02950 [Planctomyces sp.]|nr:hypothetical protein [Planctomyces sp.]